MEKVAPSERFRCELDEVLAGVAGEDDPIEMVGRLGARLILQQALEGPVGDHERRRPEAAGDHVPGEGEPRLVALPAPQSQSEEDLAALQRHAPAHKDALRRRVVGVQLQIDRIQEAVDDVVLLKAPPAPLAVSLAGVLTDPGPCSWTQSAPRRLPPKQPPHPA
jgi:hypothetical protein